MESTRVKVVSVLEDHEYNCITVELNGVTKSFALSKNTPVVGFEGKIVYLSTDKNGAFVISPANQVK